MSNFILEKLPDIPPVMDVVIPAELSAEVASQLQTDQAVSPQAPTQMELSLGVLARRAATADYYNLLTEIRGSSTETINGWKTDRDRWNDEAISLIGASPNTSITYYRTYSEVFSQLNSPKN